MIHWFKLINLIKNHARSQVTLEVLMISSARKTNTKLWCSILNTASMSWTAQQHIRIQVMEGLWLTSSQGSEGKKTEKTRTSKPPDSSPNRSWQFPPLPWRKTQTKTTTAILQVRPIWPICQTQSMPNGTAFQFQFQPRNEDFLKQIHQATRLARSKKDAESMTSSLRSWATPKFLDSNHTRVPRNKHSTLTNLDNPNYFPWSFDKFPPSGMNSQCWVDSMFLQSFCQGARNAAK